MRLPPLPLSSKDDPMPNHFKTECLFSAIRKALLVVATFLVGLTVLRSSDRNKLPSPSPRVNQHPLSPEDRSHRLIDLDTFRFTINPLRCARNYTSSVDLTAVFQFERQLISGEICNEDNPCAQSSPKGHRNYFTDNSLQSSTPGGTLDDVFLVIFVHSSPRNFERRKTIRRTWGKEDNFLYHSGINRKMRLVFILGLSENAYVNYLVKKEANIFKDIVQGNFIDSYRNLTYKHVAGLKWVTDHCGTARFVLKTDDDVYIDTTQLIYRLESLEFEQKKVRDLIACSVVHDSRPRRYLNKWQVTVEEYAGDLYPDYCSGWFVLMYQDVAAKLYLTSFDVPFFWVDDVHVTGVLASRLALTHRKLFDQASVEMMHHYMDLWLNDSSLSRPPEFENEIHPQRVQDIWFKVVTYYNSVKPRVR